MTHNLHHTVDMRAIEMHIMYYMFVSLLILHICTSYTDAGEVRQTHDILVCRRLVPFYFN